MLLEQPATTADLQLALTRSGYALLSPDLGSTLTGLDEPAWRSLRKYWDNLPQDQHLKDAGRYRARRHASLVLDISERSLTAAPHRAHWQPLHYNALHGGMSRWFEPLEDAFLSHAGVQRCISGIGNVAARIAGVDRWFVEVHQVRIDTASGIGRPTPEGAHRDGVDFVAVWLAGCDEIRGGETRVFEAHGSQGVRFTLKSGGSAMVLDDSRVIHETTPIQPGPNGGVRDTLIVTYRAGGFLAP
jgi:hypothetical protein